MVSCCGDGDVVDVGEGESDGGGFEERRKRKVKMRETAS